MSSVAYHHVEFCKHPVSIEGRPIFFDECNKQLISVSEGKICCTFLDGEKRASRAYFSTVRSSILCAKLSPDQRYIAIQFSPMEIELVNLEDGTAFVQSCKKSRGTIVGFFWTYIDNFLIITTTHIELYQFPRPPKRSAMKLIKEQKCNAAWMHYSARHRIVIVSSGIPSSGGTTTVYTYYFKPNTIIKMPRFEVDSDGSTALQPQELVVHQLYDAIYCIHIHRKELVLYQLTKETVLRRVRLDLLTVGASYIHIVDNLLLVHNIDSKVTMMFDIKSKNRDMGGFPVASPLPLSYTPYEPTSDTEFVQPTNAGQSGGTVSVPTPTVSNGDMYSLAWQFHLPYYVVDKDSKNCWTVGLNLDGIVLSLSDRCRMAEFLLRRTLPRTKTVLLRELLALVIEHEALSVSAQVFDFINAVLASHLRAGTLDQSSITRVRGNKEKEGVAAGAKEDDWSIIDPAIETDIDALEDDSGPAKEDVQSSFRSGDKGLVVITQADMYTHVFVPVEERPALDHKFVIAVVTEYIRSLNFHHIAVSPFLYELLINFLVRNNKWYQLHQFLQYHVVNDSNHVACQLLSLEQTYPPAYQLALDMLKRLNTPDQIVEVLLSKKLLLPALRFMRTHRVRIPPRRVLEVASQLNDNTLFLIVYRFFESRKELADDCDKYIKQFKSTMMAASTDRDKHHF